MDAAWILMVSIESLEARVQALEELCAQINTNVSSLQAIVDVSRTGDYITSVETVTSLWSASTTTVTVP